MHTLYIRRKDGSARTDTNLQQLCSVVKAGPNVRGLGYYVLATKVQKIEV